MAKARLYRSQKPWLPPGRPGESLLADLRKALALDVAGGSLINKPTNPDAGKPKRGSAGPAVLRSSSIGNRERPSFACNPPKHGKEAQ